nr:MAG TPA: hypothetical protein [Caudoviricetes sp.]
MLERQNGESIKEYREFMREVGGIFVRIIICLYILFWLYLI